MRQILCLIGEDLFANSDIKLFVDEMYRVVGLKPDPPNEFCWGSFDGEEETTGFGVVEFTLSIPETE